MKRYLVVAMTGTGADGDPLQPNVAGSDWVMVGPQAGNRCLVKVPVADGTAATTTTVADLQDGSGDVDALALTPAQITNIKTFLVNQGIDVSQFDADGVDDRRKLLRFLLRRWLGWRVQDFARAITGYDAN